MSATTARNRSQLAWEMLRDSRSPKWGIAGQGVRFLVSGGLVALVYSTVTIALSDGVGLAFQLALAIGFTVSVALHFTLQRLFVWRHHESFALGGSSQAVRYLTVCITQYALTALSTSQLPRLLGVSVEPVYLATILTVGAINFLVFRSCIFHPLRP
jgi:putative flippase GtrA